MVKAACLSVLLLPACGGSVPPPASPASNQAAPCPQPSGAPKTPAKDYAFSAVASSPAEGQAHARAARRLLVALLDDESLLYQDPFSDQLALAVHDRKADPMEVKPVKSGVEVELGLQQDDLPAVFDRLRAVLDQAQLPAWPEELTQAVRRVRVAHLLHAICKRKTVLLKTTCELPDLAEVDRGLTILANTLRLEPYYIGGTPHRGARPLRPLRVSAVMDIAGDALALAHLPLIITGEGLQEPIRVEADASGAISRPWPEGLAAKAKVSIAVDAARLLGPEKELLPPIDVAIQARLVGLDRSALVFSTESPAARVTAAVVVDALTHLLKSPVPLDPEDRDRIERASPQELTRLAPAVADRMRGKLDVLLVLEASSEFASRMGTHRVWYEARGTLRAVDAWSGAVLTEVSAVVTESGVGEPRAESAARESLGRQLASRIQEQLDAQKTAP